LPALEGRDIIAQAKTDIGKTLAFGIPILKGLTGMKMMMSKVLT